VPGWLWKPPENAARISGDSLLLSREVFSRIFYLASPAVIRKKTITESILQGEMNEPSDSP
jgi:hypothetical protein